MKKYIIGLFLVLFIVGCQQQPTTPAVQPEEKETPAAPPETQASTETIEQPNEEEAPAGGADVSILGKGGFDPEEITIKEGATVVFMNNADKLVTLSVWEGSRVINTAIVKGAEVGEITFDKAGSFEVKTLEYATSISVIVE